jgi:hypothetical protein
MPRWQYLSIDLANLPPRADELDLLEEAGEVGWELVIITPNNIAYFRRAVDAQANAPDERRGRRSRLGGVG